MEYAELSRFAKVSVVFEKRPDGGLRVSSPDVPGFRLSHSNPALVTADIVPALETIIGEMVGKPVFVRMASGVLPLPDMPASPTRAEFVSRLAA